MRDLRTTLLAFAFAATAIAQDLSQTIVGCVDLECPAATDNVNDNCTIADTGSFSSVGLTRVPLGSGDSNGTNSATLAGISWVKAFTVASAGDSRAFISSFYLGSPPSLQPQLNASTGGCAVFMHGASSSITFGGELNGTSQGTCADAMGASCVDALVSRATTLVEGYLRNASVGVTVENTCEKLHSDLEKSNDEACLPVSQGLWSNFTAVALTGDGAPRPITAQQNSSANCWPVTPKQDDLALIRQQATPASDLISDIEKALWAITPIITVFYNASSGSVITGVDASMSCVKTMGPARASLDTMSNGTSNDEGGAIALSSSSGLLTALYVAIIASLALYMT